MAGINFVEKPDWRVVSLGEVGEMSRHIPVMAEEVLELLAPVAGERGEAAGGLIIDGTLGMGGHTEMLLERLPWVRVLGIDRDGESLELARERLARFGDRFEAVQGDYRDLREICERRGIGESGGMLIDGILADLGISSWQLDTPERGFSLRVGSDLSSDEGGGQGEVLLDMRMDRSTGMTAAGLLRHLSERELADLIRDYGEEPAARRIARMIVRERERELIVRPGQLADLVVRAVNRKGYWRTHPATRTFQALRIAVNRELEGLGQFVADAVSMLRPEGRLPGGRLVVITFHSLEDRPIKQAMRREAGQCLCPPSHPICRCGATKRVEVLTRRALRPGDEEVAANPRARSAKLRACRRLVVSE